MHGVTMMKADNDNNDTWQTLATATARLLQRHEQQNEHGEGDPNARRGYEKDSGEQGGNIDQRRATGR